MKPTKEEFSIKKFMETPEYELKNRLLKEEINKPEHKVNIDRSVFQKTKEEKEILKTLKYNHKHNPKR